jgi:SAM-dependent methyltransferase
MLGRVIRDLLRARRDMRAQRASTPPIPTPVVLRYRPDVFDVADESSARSIILTPEDGQSTDTRWERETPYLVRLAHQALGIGPRSQVVDYGCGIGRLAGGLIEASGCSVTGVDISASMRRLAVDHVRSPLFEAVDPETFDARIAAGMRADAAISCWVLQHCVDPGVDVRRLLDALRPGGRLLVVNNLRRAVPGDAGWVDDGIDIAAMLDSRFRCVQRGALDGDVVGAAVARYSFFGVYEQR